MFTDRDFVLLMRLILRRKIPKVLVNLVLGFANPVNLGLMRLCHDGLLKCATFQGKGFDGFISLLFPEARGTSNYTTPEIVAQGFLMKKGLDFGNCDRKDHRQSSSCDQRSRVTCRNGRNLNRAAHRGYARGYEDDTVRAMQRWIDSQDFTDSIYFTADEQYQQWRRRHPRPGSAFATVNPPDPTTEGYLRVNIDVRKRHQ